MGTSIHHWVKFLFRSLADFLFPPICFGCNEEIEEGLICDSCRLLLFTSELDVCQWCGRPCLPDYWVCGRCQVPTSLSRIRAVGLYQTPFPELIHALKYLQKTALAPILGGALALLLEQDTQLKSADRISAVPLHPARLRERGYNQAYLLAQEVARLTEIPLFAPLVRRKNTPSQSKQKDEASRRKNVANAFRTKSGVRVAGMRIVLIDDVMTSGATLSAAGGELRRAGASEVMGLVVAVAIAPALRQSLKER